MRLREWLKDPNALLRIGMLFLLLASLWRWFAHPSGHLSAGVVDGVTGFFYGVSISTLLLSVVRRRNSTSGPPRV
jgi:hypothetical protein